MQFHFKNKIRFLALGGVIPIVTIVLVLLYLNTRYQYVNGRIDSLRIVFDRPVQSDNFVVYISDSTDVSVNFKQVFFPQAINDSILLVRVGKKIELRQFRLYFRRLVENITIKKVSLQSEGHEVDVDLRRLHGDLVKIVAAEKNALVFTVLSDRGFANFESPQFYYSDDYGPLLLATLLAVVCSFLLYFFLRNVDLIVKMRSLTIQEISVVAFIFSIFLPQVFFNIALVVSILLVIRNFKLHDFLANRLNLLFVLFYLITLVSFLASTPYYDFKVIEKYTPILILPIYVSCIRSNRLVIFFCVSAFLIGGSLLVEALINISIFKNQHIVSFDNFTGAIHPVYYSYLVAVSIIYIELGTNLRNKYWIHLMLVLLLILSGSKLILLAMVFWAIFFLKKSISIGAILVVVVACFTFAPFRERIVSVLGARDLSIVTEEHVEDPGDVRINGFTLRAILWQESLRNTSVKEFIFGRGVGPASGDALQLRLKERGLTKHLSLNAHNQYITTFFTTGLIGLSVLIAILFYALWTGIKSRDSVLISFTLLMTFALMSESVFERLRGIALFGMLVLLLTKSKTGNEVSMKAAP